MKKEYEFLVKFAVIFIPLYLLVQNAPLQPLTDTIASIETILLNSTGLPTIQTASFLAINSDTYHIVNDCSGLVLISMLLALLYSTDLPEQTRRKTLLWGAPFLFLFNLVRLYGTLATGALYGHQTMETAHVALWFVDSAIVLGIWYLVFSRKKILEPKKRIKK